MMRDPFAFGKEWLGLKDIPGTQSHWTIDQQRVIQAVIDHKHIAVVSGNGVGKSHLGAFLILWYLFTHPGSKVIATAATYSQISESMFPEARAMYADSKRPLGGKALMMKIEADARNPNWFATGISTDDPSSFQGRHAPYVLIIIDEATGVDGSIFEAAELMGYGPDDRIIAMANPIDASSYFFGQCDMEGDKWHKLEISCESHPNFLQRKTVIPGAISYERVVELEKEYGRDHPLFKARVLGQWSRQLGRMFPQFERPVGRHTFDPEILKLDPWLAWWGAADWGYAHNSAVLLARFDGKVTYVVRELVKSGMDARELARNVVELVNPKGTAKKDRIKLDAFCLSFDAFNKTDGPRSRAMEMGDELRKHDLPYPRPAKRDRVDGINIIRTMLNADTLKISLDCPKLIAGLKRALVNPDRPEDMLKEDGDDEVDALRYLLTTNPRMVLTPLDIAIEEKTKPLRDQGDYLTAMMTRMRMQDAARVDSNPFSLGRFLRRGRPQQPGT